MLRPLFLLAFALLVSGCASLSPETKKFITSQWPSEKILLTKVPFIKNVEGDCGPSSLLSVLEWSGAEASLLEIRQEIYSPQEKGSLPSSLMNAARSRGLMATPVNSFNSLATELRNGQPVIVLQNLGLSWLPKWHYAVVIGFDIPNQEVVLHSGEQQNLRMPMTRFERYWKLSQHWGLVVYPPNKLSRTAGELEHMQSASGIEAAGHIKAAEIAYRKILSRWPKSTLALIGLGNIAYKKKDFGSAALYLKRAQKIDPTSRVVQNNLKVLD